MSMIVSNAAGGENELYGKDFEPACNGHHNSSSCVGDMHCVWTGHTSSTVDMFGPDYKRLCWPSCYPQDHSYTTCTNASVAEKLCILAGVLNLVMGLLGLGFIVDFISYPVISGFTTSASLIIATKQIHHMLGVSNRKKKYFQWAWQVHDDFQHLPEVHWPDILMSIICILFTVAMQRLKRRMDRIGENKEINRKRTVLESTLWLIGTAGNFMTIFLGTVLAFIWRAANESEICDKHHNITTNCLTLTGDIHRGLPTPKVPDISGGDVSKYAVGIVLVALLGFLESIAIANAFARQNGYDNDLLPSQELVAIGLGNIVSGFFKSYPITGSFSRTAVNSASGVATPASGIVTGLIVMFAIQFAIPVMEKIPSASLSAIIFVSVLKMFNYKIVLKMWKVSKIDLIPWACSFFLCTLLDIKFGVLIGAGVNVVILLYNSARPEHPVLTQFTDPETGVSTWRPRGVTEKSEGPTPVTVMRVGTSLFYPAGSQWKATVRAQIAADQSSALVLDFCAVANIDYSGVQAVIECIEDCKAVGVATVLTSMVPRVADTMMRAGVIQDPNGSPPGATLCSNFVDYEALLPDAVAAAQVRSVEEGEATETTSLLPGGGSPLKSPIN